MRRLIICLLSLTVGGCVAGRASLRQNVDTYRKRPPFASVVDNVDILYTRTAEHVHGSEIEYPVLDDANQVLDFFVVAQGIDERVPIFSRTWFTDSETEDPYTQIELGRMISELESLLVMRRRQHERDDPLAAYESSCLRIADGLEKNRIVSESVSGHGVAPWPFSAALATTLPSAKYDVAKVASLSDGWRLTAQVVRVMRRRVYKSWRGSLETALDPDLGLLAPLLSRNVRGGASSADAFGTNAAVTPRANAPDTRASTQPSVQGAN